MRQDRSPSLGKETLTVPPSVACHGQGCIAVGLRAMTTLDAGRPIGVVTANAIVRAVSCRPLPVGVVAHTGGDGGKGQGGNGERARPDAVFIPSSRQEAGRRLTSEALDRSTATSGRLRIVNLPAKTEQPGYAPSPNRKCAPIRSFHTIQR